MIDASWQIEEPMEIGKLNGRRLYVGGTEGIATIAESLGKQHDMQVHVILNPQHERARLVTPLSLSQMQEGLHHVYKANETLHRNINANVLSSGYLQRNHWIVRDAQTVIAFGAFENRGFQKTVLQGGTEWSVQMGLDAQTKTVYVYDRSSKQWYTTSWIKNKDNNGRWYTWCKFIPCRKPYLDFTSTAVVGSQKPRIRRFVSKTTLPCLNFTSEG